MNIVILMAGYSDAFREAGHSYPKSLADVDGKLVVERILENYAGMAAAGARITILVRKEDNQKYRLGAVIRLLNAQANVLEVDGDTAGGACTALLAVDAIAKDEPLIVCNGDQLLDIDVVAAAKHFVQADLDGGIIVFDAVHPRWSYARVDANGLVTETAEKNPISHHATAGFYYFRKSEDFITAAQKMILKDAHVDGLFYVCPAYNQMILKGARIGVYEIAPSKYISLATPRHIEAANEHFRSGRHK